MESRLEVRRISLYVYVYYYGRTYFWLPALKYRSNIPFFTAGLSKTPMLSSLSIPQFSEGFLGQFSVSPGSHFDFGRNQSVFRNKHCCSKLRPKLRDIWGYLARIHEVFLQSSELANWANSQISSASESSRNTTGSILQSLWVLSW